MVESLREAINVAMTKAPDVWRGPGGGRARQGTFPYDDLLAPIPSALVPLRLHVSTRDEEVHAAFVELKRPPGPDNGPHDLALATVRRLLEAGACAYPFLRGVMASVDRPRGRPGGLGRRKAHRLSWAKTMLACVRLNDLFVAHEEGRLARPLLLQAVHRSLGTVAAREALLAFASMRRLAGKHSSVGDDGGLGAH